MRYHQRSFELPPGATEVVLVRHGASEAAVPGEPFPLLDGHGDPALAPEGEAQAAAVAERLAREEIAGLFVTTLRRTVQTAAPLAARLGLEPVVVPELREVSLGANEGGEFRIRMAERDPVALRAVAEERWDVIPGAESMESLAERVRTGIERVIAAAGPGVTVAAGVHGGVIGQLLTEAVGGGRSFAFVGCDNGSISHLVAIGERWVVRRFNDTAHLDASFSLRPAPLT